MSSFSDTFEMPVTNEIDGKKVTIRPLTVADYLPWCAEVAQQYRDRNRKLIPADIKPLDKMKLESEIEAFEVTPDDLRTLIFRADSAIRILRIAFRRATNSDESTADAWIATKSAKEAERLAARLCGLFESDELARWYSPKSRGAPDPKTPAAPPAAASE